eukprot:jgi/Tetstr1/433300/TSEL_022587.t1
MVGSQIILPSTEHNPVTVDLYGDALMNLPALGDAHWRVQHDAIADAFRDHCVHDLELSLPTFNVVTGSYDPRSLKSTLLEFKTMRYRVKYTTAVPRATAVDRFERSLLGDIQRGLAAWDAAWHNTEPGQKGPLRDILDMSEYTGMVFGTVAPVFSLVISSQTHPQPDPTVRSKQSRAARHGRQADAMDYFMGIKGPDFVMLCSDTSAVQQIITIKDDEDKIIPVDSHKLMALSGDPGSRVQFSDYIIANTRLYALRNSTKLSTKAVANYTRGELATALRKNPYQCNLLLAGYDEGTGPSLYWMDYLATMHQMNIAGTGYGSYFVLSLFDKLWHKDLTQDEALVMMEKGVEEVKRRLVVSNPHYEIKVVDKEGTRLVKRV